MDKLPDQLPNLSSFSHAQKDELIRMLFPLIAEVRRLSARVAELEARLSKDSHNSSKPPSSDGLAKKSASPNVPSGKKPGGQAGRAGKTLERFEHVDTVINHPLPKRCACGAAVTDADAVLLERRQVIDIPVARYHLGGLLRSGLSGCAEPCAEDRQYLQRARLEPARQHGRRPAPAAKRIRAPFPKP